MRGRGEAVSMIEQESVLRGGFAPSQRPSVLNSPGRGFSARNLIYLAPLVTAAIAHAPLLAQLGRRLWVSEQYQCFPLVLIGAVCLGWNRLASMPSTGPSPKTLSLLAAWTINLLLLITAIALNSPSVAGFSALTTGLTVAYGAVGPRAARALLPSFFYLLLILPPPFGLEQIMLLKMQQMAARASSAALDYRGIYHTLDGVTITTEVRPYFVEEACSGVNSLVSTLAVVLFILLWQRFSVLRIAIVTSLSIGWVLWGNALRVAATIILAERWNLPVLEGAGHSALGFVTFLLAIVLSLSSHAFLLFLVPAGGRSLTSLLRRWKEITPSPGTDAYAYEEPIPTRPSIAESRTTRRPQGLLLPLSVAAIYAVLGGSAIASGAWVQQVAKSDAIDPARFEAISREALPAQIGDWKQVNFEAIRRSDGAVEGAKSYRWLYDLQGLQLTISVDGPFHNWHDTEVCYQGLGWKVVDSQDHSFCDGEVTTSRLRKPNGSEAVVHFCGIVKSDDSFKVLNPPADYRNPVLRRLESWRPALDRLFGRLDAQTGDNLVIQLQVILPSEGAIRDAESQAALQVFSSAAQTLFPLVREEPAR